MLYANVPHLATVTVNSNSAAGQVALNDNGSGTAFNLNGAAALNINAGTGGITATSATNGFAELSTSGTITLAATGAIGSSTNRIQFPAGQTNVNVTNAPGGVWFDGLGSLTFGTMTTNSTTANGLNVTTEINGNITLSGPVNTSGPAAGNGSISLTANGSGAEYLNYSAGTTVATNAAAVAFANPVLLQADASIQTSAAGGSVAFSSTVDSAPATSHSLTTGSAALHFGAMTFPGAIGGTTALSALNVYGGAGSSTISLVNIGTGGAPGVAGSVIVDAGPGSIVSAMTNWRTGGNQTYAAGTKMTLNSLSAVTLATGAGGVIDLSGTAALDATASSTKTLASDDIVLGAGPANSLDFGANTLQFFTVTPSVPMHVGYAAGQWSLDQSEINRIVNADRIIFGSDGTQFGTITFQTADFSAMDGATGAKIEAYSNGAATGAIQLNDTGVSFGLNAKSKYVALFAGTATNGFPNGTITSVQLSNGLPDINTTGNIFLSASNQIGTAIRPIEVKYYSATSPEVYVGYNTDGVTSVNPSAPNGAWIEGIGGLVLNQAQLTSPGVLTLTVYNAVGHITLTNDLATGGPIVFSVPVVLASPTGTITIDSSQTNDNITFSSTSTIDADTVANGGVQSLIVKCGTGDVVFNAPIGSAQQLSDGTNVNTLLNFTVMNAHNVTFGSANPTYPNLSSTGNASITNSGVLTIGASVSAYDIDLGGSFTQSGATSVQIAGNIRTSRILAAQPIVFNSPVVLTGNISLSAGSGNVSFAPASTIDGAFTLNIDASTGGTTSFGANVGSSIPVGGSLIKATNLSLASGISYTSNGANITFQTNDLVLNAAPTATINAAAGIFQILPLNAASSMEFAPAKVLTPGTTAVYIDSRFSAVTAASFVLGGNTQQGDIHLGNGSNAVTASYNLNVTQQQSGAGKIFFENNYDSSAANKALTLSSGTGGVIFGVSTASIGVTLGNGAFQNMAGGSTGDAAITLARPGSISASGGVALSSTVDAASAGTQGLTITAGTANVSFGGIVGGNARLGALSVTGGIGTTAFIQPSSNMSANSISFAGPVQLQGTLTMDTSASNGSVSFSTTLDALAAGVQGLGITAGTGNVSFAGIVGGNARLGALSVTGGTGTTAYIKPSANMTANSMSFTGPVQLQGTLTMDTSADNGNMSFSTTLDALAAGAQALTVTAGAGNVSFAGIVGGNARLGALSVTGGTGTTAYIKPSANMTANSMSFTGPVQLQNGLTLSTSTTNGNIAFSTTMDAAAAGTQGLTIAAGTGNVSFAGIVGGNARLGALSVTGGTGTTAYIKPGANMTANFMSFTGPVQLQNGLALNTSTTNGNIAFSTTVDAAGAGTQGLTIAAGTGNVSFAGIVGGNVRLGALSVTGGTGTTAYIKPSANLTASSISFTGPVQLQASLTMDTSAANGNVSFSTTLDALAAGAQALTVAAGTGNVSFAGVVGGVARLGALSVTGGTGTTAYIKPAANLSANSISFAGPVQLQSTLIMDTSANNGNVSFGTTLDALSAGTQGLTITAGNGNVSFVGVVGGSARLGALSVAGGAGTTAYIKPSANMTTSSMSFTGPVQLQSSIIMDTSAANGNLSFATASTTLDALAAGIQGLTITAGSGSVSFLGAVGSNVRLASLNVTSANAAPGAIALGSSVLTTGNQTYSGLTTIAGVAGSVINSNTAPGLLFGANLVHTGGTIQDGPGGIRFAANYAASGATAILAGNPTAPAASIEFDGNVAFAVFTRNIDSILFQGTVSQSFDSNKQPVGPIVFNNPASVVVTTEVHQTGGTFATTIQAGTLDLATNGIGWVADSAVGTLPTAGLFQGIAGSLSIDGGARLLCVSISTSGGFAIINAGSNTVTASGSVTILGAFSSPTNSTLILTGTGVSLGSTPPIGYLHIGSGTTGVAATPTATVTLNSNLTIDGDLEINDEGSLDVSSSSFEIFFAGSNWTNRVEAVAAGARFIARAGTVKFTKASGIFYIYGNNFWYIFDCEAPGVSIFFQEAHTQSIKAPGGIFKILGASGSSITLSRQSADADLGWAINGIPSATNPDATKMWQLDLNSGATLDMAYVNVKYSDARAHPVAVPDPNTVKLFYWSNATPPVGFTYLTCYQWISGVLAIYSYTEDSDGDGKIDRIRVIAQTTLNGDFSGFTASVSGYTIDTSKGTNGYAMVPAGQTLPSSPTLYGGSGYEFFIYLVEKPYNDTEVTPSWSIVANTSLKDSSTQKLLLYPITGGGNVLTAPMIPSDTALPRIAYTMALPGQNQVFYHFSGPVCADSAGNPVTAANFSGASSISRITISGNGTSEVLATYPAAVAASAIAAGSTAYSLASTLYDASAAPTNYATDPVWVPYFISTFGGLPPAPYNNFNPISAVLPNAWPNPIASTTHRVSDLMIDLPPPASGAYNPATYFAWPVYAKDQATLTLSDTQIAALTEAQSAAEGIGLIRAFDGSQWLRTQTITVQTRVSANLGALQPSIAYDTNVASSLKGTNGLWLPNHSQSAFSGIDAIPDTSAGSQNDAVSTAAGLWNLSVPGTDSKINGEANNSLFDFFFTLSTAPSNLYVARLDIASGVAVPPDWYLHIKPFSFFFHNIVLQKGGATILNNVIDPTKGETVRLAYQLPSNGSVTVTVFTLDGDVVVRLVNGQQAAGSYSVAWNGRNLAGNAVARGLYFVRIVASGVDEIRKVLVVRHQ